MAENKLIVDLEAESQGMMVFEAIEFEVNKEIVTASFRLGRFLYDVKTRNWRLYILDGIIRV